MTSETPVRDPESGGVARGILLICAIGIALGVGYNALGLAGRPKYGLAWIKAAPQKMESLEALQTAPAEPAPAASAGAGTATGGAGSAPGTLPAAAAPATDAPGASSKPAVSAPATTHGPARAAEHAPSGSTSAARVTTPSAPPSKGAAAEPRAGNASTGAASPSGNVASSATGASPATDTAPPTGTAPATGTGPVAPAAAANLPVIPDVPGPLKVELATLKRLHDANAALVLDARDAGEYADGHISGALSLSYNDALAEPERVTKLDPGGRPIVVYCSGGDCELSHNLARVLIEAGKRKVLIYEAGYPEWAAAGYPVGKGPNP